MKETKLMALQRRYDYTLCKIEALRIEAEKLQTQLRIAKAYPDEDSIPISCSQPENEEEKD